MDLTTFEQHTQWLSHLAQRLETLVHLRRSLEEDYARVEAELDGFHKRWIGCPSLVEHLLGINNQIDRIDAEIIATFEAVRENRADG